MVLNTVFIHTNTYVQNETNLNYRQKCPRRSKEGRPAETHTNIKVGRKLLGFLREARGLLLQMRQKV